MKRSHSHKRKEATWRFFAWSLTQVNSNACPPPLKCLPRTLAFLGKASKKGGKSVYKECPHAGNLYKAPAFQNTACKWVSMREEWHSESLDHVRSLDAISLICKAQRERGSEISHSLGHSPNACNRPPVLSMISMQENWNQLILVQSLQISFIYTYGIKCITTGLTASAKINLILISGKELVYYSFEGIWVFFLNAEIILCWQLGEGRSGNSGAHE